MMLISAALALQLILLTGPDHQPIEINPGAVTNIRPQRGTDHVSPGIHCLVFLSDGHWVSVTETCDQVRAKLADGQNEE